MKNFDITIPTRILFGRDTEKQVGACIREYGFHKVLLHYGGGSVKKNGLLDRVEESLRAEGIEYVELGGVQANPVLSMVRQGIKLCLEEQVDFILAVGGGSVIDSSKAIGDGAGNPEDDVWSYFLKEAAPVHHIPVGVILTLAASGSEMSQSAVLTNEENGLKRGFNSWTHQPLFSICNPELTYTVNKFQTGCGTVDIMMHTLERYFGWSRDSAVTDRIAEGLLKAVIEAGRIADRNPEDYEARASLMWAGSLSHNGLTGLGREFLMQVHQMEHELSGMYPRIAHGAGLSALFCSWSRFVCPAAVERFAQYAVRVWNVEMNFENPMATALAGIQATEDFFKSLQMPVSLEELQVEPEKFQEMADKCTNFGARTLPGIRELGKQEMIQIYQMAYPRR
ncbi:MAG: iron-containing alcohol dehydrogenase [Lachnospiraceae bacterium]|nr:iron-containing alcohol dehydrogenase [Lachnospiraceae bacterium]